MTLRPEDASGASEPSQTAHCSSRKALTLSAENAVFPAGESTVQRRKRNTSSLYDFVKVRVWLQTDVSAPRHAHVLSRFLLSRTLTASLVPNELAIKVALEVKKHLVDSSSADMVDVSQAELEAAVFAFLSRRGFGEAYVQRYRLLSAFHARRQPLVLCMVGPRRAQKSSLAAQLAQRLNFSSVLQSDTAYRLLRPEAAWAPPEWGEGTSEAEAVSLYEAECWEVWRGLACEVRRALEDGKALVVEGFHAHPARPNHVPITRLLFAHTSLCCSGYSERRCCLPTATASSCQSSCRASDESALVIRSQILWTASWRRPWRTALRCACLLLARNRFSTH
jgi:hypothetical protein